MLYSSSPLCKRLLSETNDVVSDLVHRWFHTCAGVSVREISRSGVSVMLIDIPSVPCTEILQVILCWQRQWSSTSPITLPTVCFVKNFLVMMNLLAGQKQRCRLGEQSSGHSRGRWGWRNRGSSIYTSTLPCVNKQLAGARLGAPSWPRRVVWGQGGQSKREGMYVCI